MDLEITFVSRLMAGITALAMLGGAVWAAVMIRRLGLNAVLALVGCLLLIVDIAIYTFGYNLVDYRTGVVVVSGIGGLINVLALVLLVAAALIPRKPKQPAGPQYPFQPQQPFPQHQGYPQQPGFPQQPYPQPQQPQGPQPTEDWVPPRP